MYCFIVCHSSERSMDSDIEFEENYDYSPLPFDDLEDDVFVIQYLPAYKNLFFQI